MDGGGSRLVGLEVGECRSEHLPTLRHSTRGEQREAELSARLPDRIPVARSLEPLEASARQLHRLVGAPLHPVDGRDRQAGHAAPTVLVQGLVEDTALADLDLETYHRVTLAQSNAVMALRGLVEELRRKRGDDA